MMGKVMNFMFLVINLIIKYFIKPDKYLTKIKGIDSIWFLIVMTTKCLFMLSLFTAIILIVDYYESVIFDYYLGSIFRAIIDYLLKIIIFQITIIPFTYAMRIFKFKNHEIGFTNRIIAVLISIILIFLSLYVITL